MSRKATFVLLAVFAILLLQFADCMSAATKDQQSMQCCGSMPCDPSNQDHDCCKSMVSSQSVGVLPTAHVNFVPPIMITVDVAVVPLSIGLSESVPVDFTPLQHSPPELYTLHSSFLI